MGNFAENLNLGNRFRPPPSRPVARIDFRGVQDRKKVDLLDPTFGLFEPNPPFWPILLVTVDLLADLGWCVAPPHTPPGYGPTPEQSKNWYVGLS